MALSFATVCILPVDTNSLYGALTATYLTFLRRVTTRPVLAKMGFSPVSHFESARSFLLVWRAASVPSYSTMSKTSICAIKVCT